MSDNAQIERTKGWGVIPFGSSGLHIRHVVLWVGVSIWCGLTIVGTQIQAINALAYNLTFVIWVLIASFATRTISLTKMATCFCAGGLLLGVVSLLTMLLDPSLKTATVLRSLAMVPAEEIVKLLPVLYLLWRGRRFSAWTLGATDVLLMGTASGAGFAFAQDAYVHQQNPLIQSFLVVLPSAEIFNGRLSCGAAILTSLSAGTLGLSWLFWHKPTIRTFLLPLGLVVAIVDHFALHYSQMPDASPWMVATLNFVTANGYLAPIIFALLFAACIGADLYVLASSLPKLKELKYFSTKDRRETLDKLWDSILDLRRFSFAFFRYKRRKSVAGDLSLTVAILAKRLVNRYNALEPTSIVVNSAVGDAGLRLSFPDHGKSMTLAPEHLDNALRAKQLEGQLPLASQLNLPERYQLLQEGAAGGMGIVYKGRDATTGKAIAIKILHPQHSSSQVHVQRFLMEARASSTLQHPNIVALNDFGITDRSVAYLIMEWLEGEDLDVIFKREGTIDLARFLKIFSQTADALAHSHAKGIIHRDVKPSNIILVDREGNRDFVKIVDFGLAKMISGEDEDLHLTQTGDTVGSPMYMSPEQCAAQPLDNRSDIYSLGCVMYLALIGRAPFIADSAGQLFYKQMYEMPPRPTKLNHKLEMPELTEPLLFKALQKQPGKRFNSMEELAQELARISDLAKTVA